MGHKCLRIVLIIYTHEPTWFLEYISSIYRPQENIGGEDFDQTKVFSGHCVNTILKY